MDRFWLYDPIASIGIRFAARRIPVHECTWVIYTAMRKSEKEIDTRHKKPLHSLFRTSHVNKYTIPTWARDVTPWPERCGANDLSVHPSRAGWVAWRTECCCGRVVDRYLRFPYHWTCSECKLAGFHSRRRVELIENEIAGKIEKIMLTNLQSECAERCGVFFCRRYEQYLSCTLLRVENL